MLKNYKKNYKSNITYNMILNSPNIKYIKLLDKNKISNMEFGKEILNFIKILLCIKNIDFSYFYLNIDNLKTQNVGSLIKENTRAGYSVRHNYIVFKDYFNTDEIYHELLHLSSSIFDESNFTEFCGFSQYNYITNLKIGNAINEGYTEYLNEKIFNVKSNSYIIEKNIASCIEKIIGSNNMKKLFFKADLKGLIEKLSKYSSIEKTLEFIDLVDYVGINSDKIYKGKRLNKAFCNIIDKLIEYLILTYIIKLNNKLCDNTISKDEYDKYLYEYINSIGSFNYYDESNSYYLRFISYRKVKKKLRKVLKLIKI